jgi:4-hydroxybutyrate CoA-transferase
VNFYKWLDHNPMIEALPVSITNIPFNISQNDNMVAINSALSVDLLGQVAADTLPGIQFSGVGGQVDFVRGATDSKGGGPSLLFHPRQPKAVFHGS